MPCLMRSQSPMSCQSNVFWLMATSPGCGTWNATDFVKFHRLESAVAEHAICQCASSGTFWGLQEALLEAQEAQRLSQEVPKTVIYVIWLRGWVLHSPSRCTWQPQKPGRRRTNWAPWMQCVNAWHVLSAMLFVPFLQLRQISLEAKVELAKFQARCKAAQRKASWRI